MPTAKILPTLMLIACVGSLSISLPGCAPGVGVSLVEQSTSQLSVEQIQVHARSISVKVLSAEVLGSGFLIKQQDEVYTVLTNEHVLRAGDAPYRIQTPDGKIYQAEVPKNTEFKGNDLALLQFRSPRVAYAVAELGSSSTLTVGQKVFAAGFAEADEESRVGLFKFTSGQVSNVLNKALEGGYQVGYTNDIEKGMSGGPLLNHWGKVIGVNGKHAYPIWNVTSVFQDGSKASPDLQETINRFSWAVPIETVLQLAPPSIKLNTSFNQKTVFYDSFVEVL